MSLLPSVLPSPAWRLVPVFLLLSLSLSAQLSVTVEGVNLPCNNFARGKAFATASEGTPPYAYAWSNGGTSDTIFNLDVGTYGVTVTDGDGATASGQVTLDEPPPVTATITDPEECTAPYVIAAEPRGGVGGYTYRWSTGAETRSVSVPVGSYCVTIYDANDCGLSVCKDVEDNPPTVAVPDVELQCFGDDNGSLTATGSGGVPPYTFAWSETRSLRGSRAKNLSGPTIDGLAPGTYFVTLTDSRGCTATASGRVTEPPALEVAVLCHGENCPGEAIVVLVANATGGTPPYRYAWSTGATSDGISGLGAGNYSLTVTDANDCSVVVSKELTDTDPVEIEIVGDDLLCGVGTTGTLSVRPLTGPVSQYTYLWSTGSTSPTLTAVGPGTYTVTATDANGCTATAPATVRTIDLAVDLSATKILCAGDADATATVTVTGGDEPYTYAWTTGATTATLENLGPGTYGVTVTDANVCKVSGRIVIDQPRPLLATAVAVDPACPAGRGGSIDLTVTGGTRPYFYDWSNGALTEDLEDLAAGTYAVTITDANGCTASLSRTLTDPPGVMITPTVRDVDCFGEATGRISVTASGGRPPYTYVWSNGGTGRAITGLVAATYSVTVTDANGCAMNAAYTVDEPTDFQLTATPTDADCPDAATGNVTLTVTGATPPYRYLWSNVAETRNLTGLIAGTYTVTVTDDNDCTAVTSTTVNEPSPLSIDLTPTDVDCAGAAAGAVSTTIGGGTPPYTIAWSNGAVAPDLTGLTAGRYTLTVTDDNGCTAVANVRIGEPTELVLSADATPVDCAGEATGAIDFSVTGGTPPYTYAWSTGAAAQDLTDLAAGNYTVTVTDANDCTAAATYTVGSLSGLEIDGQPTDADCPAAATGSIDITVSGGTPAFSYRWSTGATSRNLSALTAGAYTVTVTDANGCTASETFVVDEPEALAIATVVSNVDCGGTATGMIVASATGGTGPYTFSFSNGDTGPEATELAPGNYGVTVTDARGCTTAATAIRVTAPPELTCTVAVISESTAGDNGSLAVTVVGGTAPYTYRWSTEATGATLDGLPFGDYSVTVTDASGCTTECAANLRPLAGIGDFVWLDQNANGQQDAGEPGIDDFPVFLKDSGGNIIASTRTDVNGRYAFLGLEPGTYAVFFDAPANAIITAFRTGNDARDSDADPDMGGMTPNYTLGPGEFNFTVDAGYFTEPGGAISDPCTCLNNNTTDEDGQFSEQIEVRADPGQTWTILERDNMFLLSSPPPPAAPLPVPLGTELVEVEPGVYRYDFKLIDEFTYRSVLSNGVYTLEISNRCFYPTVRFLTDPPESLCVFDAPIALEGAGSIPGEVVFTINGEVVSSLDPAALTTGEYTIEGQLLPQDPEECLAVIRRKVILIDDCEAKLGDFVWLDENANGIQDPDEPGIKGVTATVSSRDGGYTATTVTDDDGMYMFTVPPGTYKVTFAVANDSLIAAPRNAGTDDERDSDIDRTTLMTGFYTVGPDEMDFTIDAGFYYLCIDNLDDPGSIGYSQELCGPGNVPEPFVELTPATGGVGPIEYLWMYNTEDPTQDISFWQPIPGSNAPDYAPGPLFETTFFVRCVRRANCKYIEGNVLTVAVGDAAVAAGTTPGVLCVDEVGTFRADDAGALVSWEFTGSASVTTSSAASVDVSWATFGTFRATLTVSRDGCISTRTYSVSVVRHPSRCGAGLAVSGEITDRQQRAVTLEWEVPQDPGTDYAFTVLRSTGGRAFVPLATRNAPTFVSNGTERYHFDDVSPVAGRASYRVVLLDPRYGDVMSNTVELNLGPVTTALGRVFPNPTANGLLHVELREVADRDSPARVQLYDGRGQTVGFPVYATPDSGTINLTTAGRSAGVYFLRLSVGDRVETYRVVIE